MYQVTNPFGVHASKTRNVYSVSIRRLCVNHMNRLEAVFNHTVHDEKHHVLSKNCNTCSRMEIEDMINS